MFKNKKYANTLKVLVGLVVVFALALGSMSLFYLSPEKDSLQILRLDQQTVPVFRVESQITYSDDLLHKLQAQNNPTPIERLNVSLHLSDSSLDVESLIISLDTLRKYSEHIFLSITADDTLAESDYSAICKAITDRLNADSKFTNIELIWYPRTSQVLKNYKDSNIKNIGIRVKELNDLELVEAVYETFSKDKKLFIEDRVREHYGNEINSVSSTINAIYYQLAIQYPAIETIYSPYISSPFNLRDDYSLHGGSKDYLLYDTIYGRIMDKPWVTTELVDVSNKSPYHSLKTYDVLEGTEEIVLSPESHLLKDDSITSIYYRLNSTPLDSQNYYPYTVTLDTTSYAHGINRFKAIGLNAQGEMVEVASMDLIIKSNDISNRSPRTEASYALDQEPIYNTDYIPILMYHTIADVVDPEIENSSVQTERFDAQIKMLLDKGYTPINFKVLQDYVDGVGGLPEKPILLTMDDGYLNNYTHAYPIYKKYGVQATLFVSPYYMTEENDESHFGWAAAREMEASGLIDIQSHGYDHTAFTKMPLKDVPYHVSQAVGLIESQLGKRDVTVVACPQFRNNYFTRKALSDLGVEFQITKLAKKGTKFKYDNLKRINVPDTMSPEELIAAIEEVTN